MIAALVSALLPLALAISLLIVGVAAGCWAADLVVAYRRRAIFERDRVPVLALMAPAPFRAEVNVDGTGSVRLRQPYGPELEIRPDELTGVALRGEVIGRHRGVHVLPPGVARIEGPLGLASVDCRLGESEQITVYPDLPRARRLEAARRRGRASDEGRIRQRLGIGTELETIRDYLPDDDFRQINWVATARTGRPMSNQYRVDENRDLLCVVDAGRLSASPVGELTRLDVALDAVAVLAVAAEGAGDRVGVLAFAGTVLRELGPRRRGADAVVKALFDLEPADVDSDYERAFQVAGRHKRSLIVVFTDLVDEGNARTLVGAVPVLARRHAVIIASCTDPDLTGAVGGPPDDVRGLMRMRVAFDLLDARAHAVRLLEGAGARVVEAPPLALGPACVRAYARLKQRARL